MRAYSSRLEVNIMMYLGSFSKETSAAATQVNAAAFSTLAVPQLRLTK
ncbi:hypothetical protein J2T15_001212 [Paenibacillus harenae]|uniref:Uncharacterized protein n=1 Tax=Paenibacillus harenae TaxID=306543 RepID=A0ABT9U024_PAEHA|nr:hypothetical protein [Paenibacillus harenae]